ncbi:MAG: PrgI family protein [Candidatus Nealsonbacteria bacterium]
MNQFTVPQFIEHEPKIVGPLTFKQFIFVGIAGAVCFALYFALPFFLFVMASIVIMLGGFALAFLKSGGRSLPVVLKNFFGFSLAPKMYLWKHKAGLPPKIMKIAPAPKETEKSPVPTVTGKSRLNVLSTQIETKPKEE